MGGMTVSAGKLALCLGPDEWQLMAPAGQEDDITRRFDALYAQVPHSLVDIGHRETGIEIGGPAATLVLAAACPLDLAGMPAGTGARTTFDTVDRQSGAEWKSVAVRLGMGGRRILKKKNEQDVITIT